MIATGLLWFDDDIRRPLALKVAEAAERYRERIGYEPTTCQLHPAQIAAPESAASAKPRKRRATSQPPAPAVTLRLVPNEQLRPNYFFVGVEDGEPLKRVAGWRDETDEDDYNAPRSRRTASRSRASAGAHTRTAARARPARAAQAPTTTPINAPTITPAKARPAQAQSAIPAAPVAAQATPPHSMPVSDAKSKRAAKPKLAEAAIPAPAPFSKRKAPAPAANSSVQPAEPAASIGEVTPPTKTRTRRNAAPAPTPLPASETQAPQAPQEKIARSRALKETKSGTIGNAAPSPAPAEIKAPPAASKARSGAIGKFGTVAPSHTSMKAHPAPKAPDIKSGRNGKQIAATASQQSLSAAKSPTQRKAAVSAPPVEHPSAKTAKSGKIGKTPTPTGSHKSGEPAKTGRNGKAIAPRTLAKARPAASAKPQPVPLIGAESKKVNAKSGKNDKTPKPLAMQANGQKAKSGKAGIAAPAQGSLWADEPAGAAAPTTHATRRRRSA